jgi:hypothetical protein
LSAREITKPGRSSTRPQLPHRDRSVAVKSHKLEATVAPSGRPVEAIVIIPDAPAIHSQVGFPEMSTFRQE